MIMRRANIETDISSGLRPGIIAPSRERKGIGCAQTGPGLAVKEKRMIAVLRSSSPE
jgi:hypothetical protein